MGTRELCEAEGGHDVLGCFQRRPALARQAQPLEEEEEEEEGGEEGARALCDVPLQPKRPLI